MIFLEYSRKFNSKTPTVVDRKMFSVLNTPWSQFVPICTHFGPLGDHTIQPDFPIQIL